MLTNLQGKTPEPVSTLGSVTEREESPSAEPKLEAAVTHQNIGRIPGAFADDSFLFTPSARPEPDRENMHPSKVQRSTAKTTDEGLILGFSDIKKKENPIPIEDTPSKSKPISPGFEFKFANAESDLTTETKRIMESVREEAAKIKEQMRRERDEQTRKDEEAQIDISGRRIAQPKSRFSDAHKAQFSRMDSIANHPSVQKYNKTPLADLGDAVPKTLKRTQSKAELVDERPGNLAPNKRVKASGSDDVSAARPASRDGSSIPRPPGLPSAVTTPTKASLARAASAKALRNTRLPNLIHSKSNQSIVSPQKSQSNSAAASLFGLKKSISMKSILSKPQPKYSDDPIKIAAGTHLPIQEQPTGTPAKAIKRVGFAEDLTSPTPNRLTGLRMPTKVLTPFRKATADSVPARDTSSSPLKAMGTVPVSAILEQQSVVSSTSSKSLSVPKVRSEAIDIKSDPVVIPSPSPRKIMIPVSTSKASSSNGDVSYPQLKPLGAHPSQPRDFTFRAERQIKFGPSQTIRTVRPSGVPTTIESFADLPSVPHGMPNKKRSRPANDEVEEQENHPPSTDGSPSKRLRISIGQDINPSTPRKRLTKFRPASAPNSGKKTLSLSRLNFLARPKNRG